MYRAEFMWAKKFVYKMERLGERNHLSLCWMFFPYDTGHSAKVSINLCYFALTLWITCLFSFKGFPEFVHRVFRYLSIVSSINFLRHIRWFDLHWLWDLLWDRPGLTGLWAPWGKWVSLGCQIEIDKIHGLIFEKKNENG